MLRFVVTVQSQEDRCLLGEPDRHLIPVTRRGLDKARTVGIKQRLLLMLEAVLYLTRHAVYYRHPGRIIRLLGIGDRPEAIPLRFLGITRRQKGSGDRVQGRRDTIRIAALAVELVAAAHIMQRLVVLRLPHIGES